MGRTQIYLGDDELNLLKRVSRTTGASRSELIRRAVHSTFGTPTKEERLRALRATAGALKHRKQSGEEYVEDIRTEDFNERLARLGFDE
jgi:hypothetical protein